MNLKLTALALVCFGAFPQSVYPPSSSGGTGTGLPAGCTGDGSNGVGCTGAVKGGVGAATSGKVTLPSISGSPIIIQAPNGSAGATITTPAITGNLGVVCGTLVAGNQITVDSNGCLIDSGMAVGTGGPAASYYTRVVTSLDEYYRPESQRLYRKGQG